MAGPTLTGTYFTVNAAGDLTAGQDLKSTRDVVSDRDVSAARNVVVAPGKYMASSVEGNNYLDLVSSGSTTHMVRLRGYQTHVVRPDTSAYTSIHASAFTVASSRSFKENILDYKKEEARKILDCRPVSFTYKKDYNDDGGKNHVGFIAEDMVELFPETVVFDTDGKPTGIDYSKMVTPLVKLCQMQQGEIDELETRIQKLEKIIGGNEK